MVIIQRPNHFDQQKTTVQHTSLQHHDLIILAEAGKTRNKFGKLDDLLNGAGHLVGELFPEVYLCAFTDFAG